MAWFLQPPGDGASVGTFSGHERGFELGFSVLSLPHFSIPTRIFLGFALLLLAFGAVSGASLVQHQRSARTLRLLNEGYLPLALTLGEAKATQVVFSTVLDRLTSERDPSSSQGWLDVARRVRPGILRRAHLGADKAGRLSEADRDREVIRVVKALLDRVGAAYVEGDGEYEALFSALSDGRSAQVEAAVDRLTARERRIQSDLREARSALQERIATVSAAAAEQERRSAILLGALALLVMLVGIGIAGWVHRLLSPLPDLQRRVQVVAQGDLSAHPARHKDDELGRLASAFEEMVQALRKRDERLREAAEAELRLQRTQEQIVRGLSAAILVVDAELVVRTVNPAAAPILGVSANFVGSSLTESGLLERLPRLVSAVDQVLGGENRLSLPGVPLTAPGLDERRVNLVVTPFSDDQTDRDNAVLVVAEDVTDELQTKERLIHSERLAAIGRMAAHVTHEVRNPLSSIGLNVEMLEDEFDGQNEEAAALVGSIHREIDRLTNITEEYLRLARLPSPVLESDDLASAVRKVARFVEPEMAAARVTLAVEVGDLRPIAFDESQIRQALLNLLRNARESMAQGGTIRLMAENSVRDFNGRPAAPGVLLAVSDEGEGIESSLQEKVFDLYYTTKERGTGLGLPLTRQIVVAHGGQIDCTSGKDGTRFEIWLPELGSQLPIAKKTG